MRAAPDTGNRPRWHWAVQLPERFRTCGKLPMGRSQRIAVRGFGAQPGRMRRLVFLGDEERTPKDSEPLPNRYLLGTDAR